ncbi:MAG: hypothetical protein LBE83_01760 [Propionibacteriaceae bacterium]|jgi:hypothetical protein|nr:hypothetical protein [Propionibacteriaceae bacterium]
MDYSSDAFLARIDDLVNEALVKLADNVSDPALKEAAWKVSRGELDFSDFLQRSDVSSLVDKGMRQFGEQVRSLSTEEREDFVKTAMTQAQNAGLADEQSGLLTLRTFDEPDAR